MVEEGISVPLSGLPRSWFRAEADDWNGVSGDRIRILPLEVRPYPLYNEIGWVQGGLTVLVYSLRASKSRRGLQRCAMARRGVLEPKKPGHRSTALF